MSAKKNNNSAEGDVKKASTESAVEIPPTNYADTSSFKNPVWGDRPPTGTESPAASLVDLKSSVEEVVVIDGTEESSAALSRKRASKKASKKTSNKPTKKADAASAPSCVEVADPPAVPASAPATAATAAPATAATAQVGRQRRDSALGIAAVSAPAKTAPAVSLDPPAVASSSAATPSDTEGSARKKARNNRGWSRGRSPTRAPAGNGADACRSRSRSPTRADVVTPVTSTTNTTTPRQRRDSVKASSEVGVTAKDNAESPMAPTPDPASTHVPVIAAGRRNNQSAPVASQLFQFGVGASNFSRAAGAAPPVTYPDAKLANHARARATAPVAASSHMDRVRAAAAKQARTAAIATAVRSEQEALARMEKALADGEDVPCAHPCCRDPRCLLKHATCQFAASKLGCKFANCLDKGAPRESRARRGSYSGKPANFKQMCPSGMDCANLAGCEDEHDCRYFKKDVGCANSKCKYFHIGAGEAVRTDPAPAQPASEPMPKARPRSASLSRVSSTATPSAAPTVAPNTRPRSASLSRGPKMCRDGSGCKKENCKFVHPEGGVTVRAEPAPAQSASASGATPNAKHRRGSLSRASSGAGMCKNGKNCDHKEKCKYEHWCKYDNECTHGDECKFLHSSS